MNVRLYISQINGAANWKKKFNLRWPKYKKIKETLDLKTMTLRSPDETNFMDISFAMRTFLCANGPTLHLSHYKLNLKEKCKTIFYTKCFRRACRSWWTLSYKLEHFWLKLNILKFTCHTKLLAYFIFVPTQPRLTIRWILKVRADINLMA